MGHYTISESGRRYPVSRPTAFALMSKVLDEHPQMDGIRPLYAIYLAGAGRREDAMKQLSEDALNLSRADHDMAYWVGSTYSILGEKDLAFKWLNKAIRLGNQNKPYFETDKNLDSIRSDPRWAELMEKVSNGD